MEGTGKTRNFRLNARASLGTILQPAPAESPPCRQVHTSLIGSFESTTVTVAQHSSLGGLRSRAGLTRRDVPPGRGTRTSDCRLAFSRRPCSPGPLQAPMPVALAGPGGTASSAPGPARDSEAASATVAVPQRKPEQPATGSDSEAARGMIPVGVRASPA